jgi:hypothetical protein
MAAKTGSARDKKKIRPALALGQPIQAVVSEGLIKGRLGSTCRRGVAVGRDAAGIVVSHGAPHTRRVGAAHGVAQRIALEAQMLVLRHTPGA